MDDLSTGVGFALIVQGFFMVIVVTSVLVYGAVYMISDFISGMVGVPYIAEVPLLSFFLFGVICVMNKSGVLEKYRICSSKTISRSFIVSAPLFVIPALNLWFADYISKVETIGIRDILLILFLGIAAFSEELLFRSVLPVLFSERYRISLFRRTIAANVLFAAAHMGNAIAGASLKVSSVQALLALGIGICFSGITEKTKSLYPAACIHWFINLSSMCRDLNLSVISNSELLIWIGISVMCVFYGLILLNSTKEVA